MSEDLDLVLASSAENVPVVRQAVRGLLDAAEVEDQIAGDVLLAVTEACTNVVRHAYRDGSGPGEIEIMASRDGHRLVIAVRDRGCGLTPRIDSPGLGLGLPVMAAVSDRMEVHEADGGGTLVTMEFALAAAADGARG
ncbi:MAG TPA: ATP-binding protein [Gaiellales bacterium]|jgi:anti-sigma regulatory factor (Ser/Thr protein kinase)|nr:ATP-binding protein [Gaiellales bacterium]